MRLGVSCSEFSQYALLGWLNLGTRRILDDQLDSAIASDCQQQRRATTARHPIRPSVIDQPLARHHLPCCAGHSGLALYTEERDAPLLSTRVFTFNMDSSIRCEDPKRRPLAVYAPVCPRAARRSSDQRSSLPATTAHVSHPHPNCSTWHALGATVLLHQDIEPCLIAAICIFVAAALLCSPHRICPAPVTHEGPPLLLLALFGLREAGIKLKFEVTAIKNCVANNANQCGIKPLGPSLMPSTCDRPVWSARPVVSGHSYANQLPANLADGLTTAWRHRPGRMGRVGASSSSCRPASSLVPLKFTAQALRTALTDGTAAMTEFAVCKESVAAGHRGQLGRPLELDGWTPTCRGAPGRGEGRAAPRVGREAGRRLTPPPPPVAGGEASYYAGACPRQAPRTTTRTAHAAHRVVRRRVRLTQATAPPSPLAALLP